MVLLLENDEPSSSHIEVQCELPDSTEEDFSICLPSSHSVKELFATLSNRISFCFDLWLIKDGRETELKRDEEKSLKEAGLSSGSANQNVLRVVAQKTVPPPSIVISLANKVEENTKTYTKDSMDDGGTNENSEQPSEKPMAPRIHRGRSHRSNSKFSAKVSMMVPKSQSSTEQKHGSSLLSWTQPNIGYVGLVNQAMTCYLNSLLQALYMTPEFRNSLYKWEFVGSAEEMPKSIPYQLQKLFVSLQTSKRSAVETSKLTKSFGWDASDSWQQHDIQELCRVMFDALEQKFKDTDQAEFINNLYQGKLIDYVSCLECKTEKTRSDTFLDIPLSVRPFGSTVAYNSVAEALQAFIQPETLDGNNQYFCETCNKKCDAHKGLKFSHFPYILTLHLKRFDFDYSVMSRIKLIDRVEFPHTLNINEYLCEETKNSLSTATEEDACSPANDDGSITDSAFTGDDEGCQGAEALQGSTSGSNSSGSNMDIQDEDEGIDLTNGVSTHHENEKNRMRTERDGPPGPYIYELFAIMIHSGSASGGHYYVYIKDFDKGEWFCFDDQSVSRITNDDISMTYGGGSHRGYYSGAHSSSTNAYMLMYRQMDKKRNQAAMAVDEFPPHLQDLMRKMQEDEEEERILRERDKDRLKIKVFFNMPGESTKFEKKLVIDGDTTLADATAVAHSLFSLEDIIPLEQCRLVSYDSASETMDLSFEGQEGEPMSDIYSSIQNQLAQNLYLEVREADSQFEPYRPGGVSIKVYRVNMKSKEVDNPVEVRTQLKTAFGEMRSKIAKAVKLSPNIKLMMEEYGKSPIELSDEKTLASAGFYTTNKIFAAEISESEPEVAFMKKMVSLIETFSNTITLHCNLPDTDRESLAKLCITPVSSSDANKLTNGDSEGVGDPVFMSRGVSGGTYPQVPAIEGEEECAGATGCSDQSASEDSSLTDSDRTIVGDEADYCLAELSSASNSPAGSGVSSPEERDPSQFSPMKKEDERNTSDKEGDIMSDDELLSDPCYLKHKILIHPYDRQDSKNMVRVQVDKRLLMNSLRVALAQHMGVHPDYLKLFRKCRSNEIPYSCLSDPLSHLRDEEHLIVRLERALRQGEYRGKVYQLLGDEPIKFLCDWILTEDTLVGEAKKQILDELQRKDDLDIAYEKCRLRVKKWKTPGKILFDSQSFHDVGLCSNWELFLQELNEPENVTSPSQVTIMLMRFSKSDRPVGDYHEITLQSSSFKELIETLHAATDIPLDCLEFSRGCFPHNQYKRDNLEWKPELICPLEDGTILFYRNKNEDETTNYQNRTAKRVVTMSKHGSSPNNKDETEEVDVDDSDERQLVKNRRQVRRAKPFSFSRARLAKDEKALKITVNPVKDSIGTDE